MLHLLIISFVISATIGWLVVRWQDVHSKYSGDRSASSAHKIHKGVVPRIGGIVIVAGWTAGLLLAIYKQRIPFEEALFWSISLTPVFIGGLVEDISKAVTATTRLLISFATAGLSMYFLGATLTRVDIVIVDQLFVVIPVLSIVFTLVAVGGIAHAINIVDGLNGLAAGVCILSYTALGYVAYTVGDREILAFCTIGLGSLLGFYVWNYPSGQLFCGDGGAYFLGANIAILSVLLVVRNPEVSAWFPMLLVLYPVWETLFSAYRRRFLRGGKSTVADRLHLHTLLYKRLHCGSQPHQRGPRRSRRNSDVSVHLIMLAGSTALPAVLFWNCTYCLLAAAGTFILIYLVIYRSLVRFKLSRFVHKPMPSAQLTESNTSGNTLSGL